MKLRLGFKPTRPGFWWVQVGGMRKSPKRITVCEVFVQERFDLGLSFRVAGGGESYRPLRNWIFLDEIVMPDLELPVEPEKWQGVNA